uniref:Uncharacterized protein n=1 Tax=Oryza brachyantha TaxID=4533 RepID=J3MMF7_ORYBR
MWSEVGAVVCAVGGIILCCIHLVARGTNHHVAFSLWQLERALLKGTLPLASAAIVLVVCVLRNGHLS